MSIDLFSTVIMQAKASGDLPAHLVVKQWLAQNRKNPPPETRARLKRISYTKEYKEWAARFKVVTKERWGTNSRGKSIDRYYEVFFDGTKISEVTSVAKFRALVKEKFND